MRGRDIVMLSDGSPRRTFCYVADAVVGYYKILVRGQPGEPYNIGVENPEISMADLAEKMVGIARDLGYQGQIVRQKRQNPASLVANPNRPCPLITNTRTD